jgi:hypothetical protein
MSDIDKQSDASTSPGREWLDLRNQEDIGMLDDTQTQS